MSIEYVVRYSPLPWLVRWVQEASYKLLTVREQSLYYVEHNVEAAPRDSATRAEYYRKMFEIGGIIRTKSGGERICLMSTRGDVSSTFPANLIPVTRALRDPTSPETAPSPDDPPANQPAADHQEILDPPPPADNIVSDCSGDDSNPSPEQLNCPPPRHHPVIDHPSVESMKMLWRASSRDFSRRPPTIHSQANGGPKKFLAWLDRLEASWRPIVEEAVSPVCGIYWQSIALSPLLLISSSSRSRGCTPSRL